MQIGGRQIDAPNPYIIAEIGVNHDGSADRAVALTEAAASAGADAVKLQYFRTDLLLSRAAKLASYQRAAGETDPLEMLRRLELPLSAMARVVERAHALGIHAVVTVFSLELVAEAEALPFDAYKAASPDIVHRPLLEWLSATGKPLIVSTGASTLDEVKQARRWLDPAADRLAFLQCVSCYPTPVDEAAILALLDIREAVRLPTGYSDHTVHVDTGALAVGAGAVILEKHLTYDRTARGPDHAASLDAALLSQYVHLARTAAHAPPIAQAAGQPPPGVVAKSVLDCERDVRTLSRQSITSRRPLAEGATLREDDLTFKRPGTGIAPFHVREIIGRTLRRPIGEDMPLAWEDLR